MRVLVVAVVAAAMLPSWAVAQDICPGDALGCVEEEADWHWRDALFDDIDIDTGWIPPGSPIQLRFALLIGGSTEIDQGGRIGVYWPPPLGVGVVGRPETGRLAINYGIELLAQLRFDIDIAGIRYRWEGDIPIPGIPEDLRMAGETIFDPFLLPSATPAMIEDTTDRVEVVRYDALGGLISIPGVGGGIVLTVQGRLAASYYTDRIVVSNGTPIVDELIHTTIVPADEATDFGGFQDVFVHPEGTLSYDGEVIVSPALFLSFVGTRRDYPLVEIPIPFLDSDSNVIFDDHMVHVPLPDIEVSDTRIEYGTVDVGMRAERVVTIANVGEAPLDATFRLFSSEFFAGAASAVLEPGMSLDVPVVFEPTMHGPATATLRIESNDPDEGVLILELSGDGFDPPPPPPADAGVPSGDAGPIGPPPDDGGCGCSTPGSEPLRAPLPAALWLPLLFTGAVRIYTCRRGYERRRRRNR